MSHRVLLYVQHLLGIGHVKRSALLARGLVAAELEVDVVSGGMAVPNLDLGGATLFQLPPVRSGKAGFFDLVDAHGNAVDDAWKARRADILLDYVKQRRPDAIVIELFPFGRTQMAFELIPMLDAAIARQPRPRIISSVRDILQTGRKERRIVEAVARVHAYFDDILVHGDPALARFEETFPKSADIAEKLHYTGLIAEGLDGSGLPTQRQGVVVSAGGGALSEQILATAIEARPMTRLRDAPWRLIIGPNLEDGAADRLRAAAPDGVTVEGFHDDFAGLLARTEVSISRCGYNTVSDLLRARPRAVIIPFASGDETEQALRARRLAGRGLAQVVEEKALTPRSLADAVETALDGPAPDGGGFDLDGAAKSGKLVAAWLNGQSS